MTMHTLGLRPSWSLTLILPVDPGPVAYTCKPSYLGGFCKMGAILISQQNLILKRRGEGKGGKQEE